MPKHDGKVQCALCGKWYKQITVSHLTQFHPDMSHERYTELYGPTTAKQLALVAVRKDALSPIAKDLIAQITGDKDLMKDLTAKIGDGLLGDAMRGMTTRALVTVLHSRLAAMEQAARNVGKVNSELFEEWRVKAGRDDGGPTATSDLVKMGYLAQNELKDIAESILRVGQMAVLDGQRNVGPNIQVQVFSGEHEKVVMPDGLTPQRREQMRLFAHKFHRPTRDIKALIAKARSLREDADAEPIEVEVINAASDDEEDDECPAE